MHVDELIAYYPRLHHMAADGSWRSIQQHGLLSTEQLVDLFEVPDPDRTRLLTQHRPECVTLTHPTHGRAIIRDQKPLQLSKLARLLDDATIPEWIQLLNQHVFFWLNPQRLEGLINARPYRFRPHIVLTLDTSTLVRAHADRIRLSRINSGATIYLTGRRGFKTFQTISNYPHPRVRGSIPSTHVAELAVIGGVHDILQHTLLVQRRQGNTVLETIYRREPSRI